MLDIPRTNRNERMQQVRVLLSFIKEQESEATPPIDSEVVKVLRGLFFVHLYGAFEKSVNEAIELFLQKVNLVEVVTNHLNPRFFPTALHSHFMALRDSPAWSQRAKFVNEMLSSLPFQNGNNTVFATKLQNVKIAQLEEVLSFLGFDTPVFTVATDRLYIDEIVDKRNQVAHGRNSPLFVGSSGRHLDLELRFEAITRVLEELHTALEQNFNSLSFVIEPNRSLYQSKL